MDFGDKMISGELEERQKPASQVERVEGMVQQINKG
jgi:hypothetical protein